MNLYETTLNTTNKYIKEVKVFRIIIILFETIYLYQY